MKTIHVFQITGQRQLANGQRTLLSTAFGADEDAAWRNFDRMQNKPAFQGNKWERHELTFEPVPETP